MATAVTSRRQALPESAQMRCSQCRRAAAPPGMCRQARRWQWLQRLPATAGLRRPQAASLATALRWDLASDLMTPAAAIRRAYQGRWHHTAAGRRCRHHRAGAGCSRCRRRRSCWRCRRRPLPSRHRGGRRLLAPLRSRHKRRAKPASHLRLLPPRPGSRCMLPQSSGRRSRPLQHRQPVPSWAGRNRRTGSRRARTQSSRGRRGIRQGTRSRRSSGSRKRLGGRSRCCGPA